MEIQIRKLKVQTYPEAFREKLREKMKKKFKDLKTFTIYLRINTKS